MQKQQQESWTNLDFDPDSKENRKRELRRQKYLWANIISVIICLASLFVIGMLVRKIVLDDREQALYTFSDETQDDGSEEINETADFGSAASADGALQDESDTDGDPQDAADNGTADNEAAQTDSRALPDYYEKKYPVETPVRYSAEEIQEKLTELAETDERFEEICRQPDQYPESLLNNLCCNPNMIDYALGYPDNYGTVSGTLEESELKADIPLFIQWDPRWGYAAYGNDAVGLSGCGPTCLSMVIVGLTKNENATPDALAAYAMDNNYYESGSGTKWSFMMEAGEVYGVQSSYLSLRKELIFEELAEGHPIICSMNAGDFTAHGHFIVLVGIEDGKIRVNDPNSVERSEKLWDYDTLKTQISSLWVFTRTEETE